jgi:hypothetical protein
VTKRKKRRSNSWIIRLIVTITLAAPALEDDHDDANGRLQLLQLKTIRDLRRRLAHGAKQMTIRDRESELPSLDGEHEGSKSPRALRCTCRRGPPAARRP